MKTLLFLFIVTFPGTLAAQTFEGKIVLKGPDNEFASYFIKGDNVRVETTSEEGKIIFLRNTKRPSMYVLIPKDKMYSEMPLITLTNESGEVEDDSKNITRTGETKLIHGYKCEKWTFNDSGNRTEVWMTDQLGITYSHIVNPVITASANVWTHKLNRYFPMLMTVTSKKGKSETFIDVVSIEKKSLGNDLFNVPAGFQKLTR